MTRIGDLTFSPELFFRFVTAFVYDPEDGKWLFTLQRDRTSRNLWLPPGGEIDIPNTSVEACLCESVEEVGIEINPLLLLGIRELYDDASPYFNDSSTTKTYVTGLNGLGEQKHPHTELIDYLCLLAGGEACCMPQPQEPEYEIVDLRWETAAEIHRLVESKKIGTYPDILDVLDKAQKWIDLLSQKENWANEFPCK